MNITAGCVVVAEQRRRGDDTTGRVSEQMSLAATAPVHVHAAEERPYFGDEQSGTSQCKLAVGR